LNCLPDLYGHFDSTLKVRSSGKSISAFNFMDKFCDILMEQ